MDVHNSSTNSGCTAAVAASRSCLLKVLSMSEELYQDIILSSVCFAFASSDNFFITLGNNHQCLRRFVLGFTMMQRKFSLWKTAGTS